MKAVKGNKEYLIDESQKKNYQDRGFDIIDDDGSVVTYGRGKTVPYDEYEKVVAQNKALKEQVEALTASDTGEGADADTGEPAAEKPKSSGKSSSKG